MKLEGILLARELIFLEDLRGILSDTLEVIQLHRQVKAPGIKREIDVYMVRAMILREETLAEIKITEIALEINLRAFFARRKRKRRQK